MVIALVGAVGWVQTLPALPGSGARAALAAGALSTLVAAFAGGFRKRRELSGLLLSVGAACGGALYAMERAEMRLDNGLPSLHQNQVARLVLQVASLPQETVDGVRFDADVLASRPAGVPERIRVMWRFHAFGASAGRHGAPLSRPGTEAATLAGKPDAEALADAKEALAPPAASHSPQVAPGQRWCLAALLRRPHAPQNPHAADGEAGLFRQKIRAIATVRGRPRRCGAAPNTAAPIAIHRARHVIRARMREALQGLPYGAVIIALALGDQAGVPAADWRVFNLTGITHLVSISGLHVTLVAGLAGMAASWGWRRWRWRGRAMAERLPARIAAASVALLVALVYCLLAGWGIPARRTFFCLAVAVVACMCRLPLDGYRVLALAAAVVTLLDPWVVVAPGFWLSFGAVIIVLAFGRRTAAVREGVPAVMWRRAMVGVVKAARLQCAVTAGLFPALAAMTQQMALAAPLANAIAIPVVSFVVTPLALLCAGAAALAAPLHVLVAQISEPDSLRAIGAAAALSGATWVAHWTGWLAHSAFAAVMVPVRTLAEAGWAVRAVAAPPAWCLALAGAGVAAALLLVGWPGRRLGWLLMLPALCWRPERPEPGDWRMAVLDVGQGAAVVLETATHTLLFDTGPGSHHGADAGARVVWPYLRARGVSGLDVLIVSHSDRDHAGGLRSILAATPVAQAYASFDLKAYLARRAAHCGDGPCGRDAAAPAPAFSLPARSDACRNGVSWKFDGVDLRFLHPPASMAGARRVNARSCVLAVHGRHHGALLPGDIGAAQERTLATGLAPVDVLVVPHHGAAGSSSAALIDASRPRHVVAQVGYLNRFHHPAPAVQRRWQRAGAVFWRTDVHGAVIVTSSREGLRVAAQRDVARRYWHGR